MSFALVLLIALAAAFMPLGDDKPMGHEIKIAVLDSTSLPATVKAFGGYVEFGPLLIPNWFATLVILGGGLLGMCNVKKLTDFPSGVLMTLFLIAAAHCLLLLFAMLPASRGQGPPTIGLGLILTLLAAIAGCVLSSERVVMSRSRVWMTLIVLHLTAAFNLMFVVDMLRPDSGRSIDDRGFVPQILLSFLVAVASEIVAIGLHRRHFWAWVAGLVVSALLIFPMCCLPFGIFGLWGLLAPASQAEFRKPAPKDESTIEEAS